MKKLIPITSELYVLPHHIAAVSYVDEEKCAVFLVGQSAIDGSFLVERPVEDVVEDINSGLEEECLTKAKIQAEASVVAQRKASPGEDHGKEKR